MNLPEMLREVVLSMEQPATWKWLVTAGIFLVSLEVLYLRVWFLALRADSSTSDDCGSWEVAYPSFLWPVDLFMSFPIIPGSEFLAAL